MSDQDLPARQRPNANYSLSNPDDKKVSDENLNFRYSRERRLAGAPKSVQDLYNEPAKNRFGIFGPLVADKPRRILFFVIVFLCLLIWALFLLGFFETSYSLEGNKIEVSGISVDDNTIIRIKKTKGNSDVYTGAVDIAVSPVMQDETENYPVFFHRVFFSFEQEEEYRFAVPFGSGELLMVFQTDAQKSSLQIRFKPD